MNKEDQVPVLALKKMQGFYQRLAEKLAVMGLFVEAQDLHNVHPLLRVQQNIQVLIEHFVDKADEVFQEHTVLGDVVRQNQQFMSSFYDSMLGLTQSLIKYSRQLYSSTQSLEILRSFRMLYESFSSSSTLLNGYTGLTEDFSEFQKKYVQEQVSLFDKVMVKGYKEEGYSRDTIGQLDAQENQHLREQNAQLKQVLRRYEEELSKYSPKGVTANGQIEYPDKTTDYPSSRYSSSGNLSLTRKISELEDIIANNNEDFAVEIQRYNGLLYEEREQFARLQREADQQVRRLQYSLRQMEKHLQTYKEEKFKDQLMIENMARKLRGFQRQRKGVGSPAGRLQNASSALHLGIPKRQQSGLLYKREVDF